jgi:hypothetical protein
MKQSSLAWQSNWQDISSGGLMEWRIGPTRVWLKIASWNSFLTIPGQTATDLNNKHVNQLMGTWTYFKKRLSERWHKWKTFAHACISERFSVKSNLVPRSPEPAFLSVNMFTITQSCIRLICIQTSLIQFSWCFHTKPGYQAVGVIAVECRILKRKQKISRVRTLMKSGVTIIRRCLKLIINITLIVYYSIMVLTLF